MRRARPVPPDSTPDSSADRLAPQCNACVCCVHASLGRTVHVSDDVDSSVLFTRLHPFVVVDELLSPILENIDEFARVDSSGVGQMYTYDATPK